MEIRKINKTIDEILKGAEYIGCGASKEAYVKDGIVYKIPRGRYLIERNELNLYFPNFMDDVNDFLGEIYEEEEAEEKAEKENQSSNKRNKKSSK